MTGSENAMNHFLAAHTGQYGKVKGLHIQTIHAGEPHYGIPESIEQVIARLVARAIAGMVKDGVPVNMQCVGAGAVNQAIKAMAIARGFLIPTGFDISCAPTFSDILINGESRTAIRLAVIVHRISLQGAEADQVSDAAMVY